MVLAVSDGGRGGAECSGGGIETANMRQRSSSFGFFLFKATPDSGLGSLFLFSDLLIFFFFLSFDCSNSSVNGQIGPGLHGGGRSTGLGMCGQERRCTGQL